MADDADFRKGAWTNEEDKLLEELVVKHGTRNWTVIAAGIKGRSGKSCRLRWHNQLNPDVNKLPFSEWEQAVIVKAQSIHQNRWAAIARLLQGRTDNSVKNHWHATLSRKCSNGTLKNKYLDEGVSLEWLLKNPEHKESADVARTSVVRKVMLNKQALMKAKIAKRKRSKRPKAPTATNLTVRVPPPGAARTEAVHPNPAQVQHSEGSSCGGSPVATDRFALPGKVLTSPMACTSISSGSAETTGIAPLSSTEAVPSAATAMAPSRAPMSVPPPPTAFSPVKSSNNPQKLAHAQGLSPADVGIRQGSIVSCSSSLSLSTVATAGGAIAAARATAAGRSCRGPLGPATHIIRAGSESPLSHHQGGGVVGASTVSDDDEEMDDATCKYILDVELCAEAKVARTVTTGSLDGTMQKTWSGNLDALLVPCASVPVVPAQLIPGGRLQSQMEVDMCGPAPRGGLSTAPPPPCYCAECRMGLNPAPGPRDYSCGPSSYSLGRPHPDINDMGGYYSGSMYSSSSMGRDYYPAPKSHGRYAGVDPYMSSGYPYPATDSSHFPPGLPPLRTQMSSVASHDTLSSYPSAEQLSRPVLPTVRSNQSTVSHLTVPARRPVSRPLLMPGVHSIPGIPVSSPGGYMAGPEPLSGMLISQSSVQSGGYLGSALGSLTPHAAGPLCGVAGLPGDVLSPSSLSPEPDMYNLDAMLLPEDVERDMMMI